VAVGVIAIGGGGIFLLAEHDPYLYLNDPDPLALTPGGDAAFWEDATLERVTINTDTGNARLVVLTRDGDRSRQELQYKDSADNVNHYAFTDAATQTQVDMSVNMNTYEYFYTETSIKAGQPYTVKAHGWLKHGFPPEDKRAAATPQADVSLA
jgi:hypothetical protein